MTIMSTQNQTSHTSSNLPLGSFFDSFVRQIGGVINGR
jgi:hypothetical protein